jgi:hypothetical protein
MNDRIEELQEKMQEFILEHADIGQRSASWGELADLQAVAESEWNETDEGKELKALLKDEQTRIIFRVDERDKGFEVIAVFPAMAGDMNPYRTCAGYMHIGQHTTISVDVMSWTRPAKPEEYKNLLAELVSVGYDNLKIMKRFTRQDLESRKAQTNL